ncbi:MAG: hypothetical protein JO268_20890 [Pseudonocardiales bacterium]|nr:hypothetical protein [Pseudonocardiales bacterium]
MAASVIGCALRGVAGGGGVRPVFRSGSSGYQTSRNPLCQVLCEVLVDGVRAGRGAAGGIGSVPFRACAALYGLLLDHPVDEWGRCRSCRRPGSVFGSRWRHCQVHGKATLCLRQLDEVLLLSLLASEWELAVAPPPEAPGPDRAGDP